jgi:hypothetical protein
MEKRQKDNPVPIKKSIEIETPKPALIDLTSFMAIESLFLKGKKDPWAKQVIGKFSDFFIYNDIIRHTLPVAGKTDTDLESVPVPKILKDLKNIDSNVFKIEPYSTLEKRVLSDESLDDSLYRFYNWAILNRNTLREWCRFHNSDWIINNRIGRIANDYVFFVDKVQESERFSELSKKTSIEISELLYAFDSVLRFPVYGEMTGDGAFYFNHPLRDSFILPTMEKNIPSNRIPLSFEKTFSSLSEHLSREEFINMLFNIKRLVREYKINESVNGEFDKEIIREIAIKSEIPPRLKSTGKVAGILGGVLGGLGVSPELGPIGALLGGAVSVSSALWTGTLPRKTGRVKWLQWALEWDIENQAESRY